MKRKKRYGGLIVCLILMSVFGLFFWYITKPSKIGIAKKELKTITNLSDLKANWDKYISFQANEDYIELVRDKAKKIISNDDELKEVKTWLPAQQTVVNFIVVPDLSNRITRIQGQFQKDTAIIHYIWKEFVRISSTYNEKQNKNKFTLDLTDRNQAGAAIQLLADSLITDISKKGANIPTRTYLEKESADKLKEMDLIYQMAFKTPTTGADYWEFFEKRLENPKSTIDIDFKNIVFLITDGYLETQNRNYTNCSLAYQDFNSNMLSNSFEHSKFFIPKCPSVDLANTDICLLEVRERESGRFKDATILKMYWYYWFKSMGFENTSFSNFAFFESKDALQSTKNEISKFIKSSMKD